MRRRPVDVAARLLSSAVRTARRSASRGHPAYRLRALVRQPGAVPHPAPRPAAGGHRRPLLQLRRQRRRGRGRGRGRLGRRPPPEPASAPLRVGGQPAGQRRGGDVPLVPVAAPLLSAVSTASTEYRLCTARLSSVSTASTEYRLFTAQLSAMSTVSTSSDFVPLLSAVRTVITEYRLCTAQLSAVSTAVKTGIVPTARDDTVPLRVYLPCTVYIVRVYLRVYILRMCTGSQYPTADVTTRYWHCFIPICHKYRRGVSPSPAW